ncbi:MAG: hypothetical protein IKC46_06385 [Lachnospiraceae bacterium]|nr:hypothetical protein [Lachnospiraceae bacterium]
MNKLETPLGEIHIFIDNNEINYHFEQLELLKVLCPDVDGRYKIVIPFRLDKKEHVIKCVFASEDSYDYDDSSPESGDHLECQAFYKGSLKMSMGAEVSFDDEYDFLYLKNGIAYVILPSTKATKFVFGICWIFNNVDDETEAQTWFGADPTIM